MSFKKCKLFTNCIDYLVHVIYSERLKASTQNIDAIPGFERSNSVTEIPAFFGLYSIFCSCDAKYRCIVMPRTEKIGILPLQTFDVPTNNQVRAWKVSKEKFVKTQC